MARATGGDVILELMTTVGELKESMRQQSEQMTELAAGMKHNSHQFGRIAKLLGALAEFTEVRFDELEARLSRVEAASGK